MLCSVDSDILNLTPYDDMIYNTFREDFPTLKIDVLNEDDLKNPTAKIKWRNFIEKFNKLDDYTYGTLIRSEAAKEFSPENSIFVVRIQFLAIEIARNREGYNSAVRKIFAGKDNAER